MATQNPANPTPTEKSVQESRKRIPMSIPSRKLEVPDIEGFHLYWFLDRNVPRALQGGYEPVTVDEVPTHQVGIANDTSLSGNTNLGSAIRIVAGAAENGGAEYLHLMKIRLDWYLEDRKVLEKRNADILSAVFKQEQILGSENVRPEDRGARYVKTALFNRPARKGEK